MNVEQERARRIGGVGGVGFALGQAPYQEAVHGAKSELAALGALGGARHLAQHPGDFGGGEVRVENQPGLAGDAGLVAASLEVGAILGGASVLPDDGVVDGAAIGPI